ncbi:hypothetical protein GcC1_096030 [Golovinomyces cichoracearum]|uniref:HTH CENPB-type domain-containing protein n=1 Tax=Golovinomyces cichoracearum TaxID=62708 RepID=A0A420IBD8_9PEZI|nr:hypothetical protein GcC1_096030 [Golovinomyces cichoracearum]
MRARTGQSSGTNKKLSDEQDAALCLYCDRYLYLGTNHKKKCIRLAANSILKAAGSTENVGRDWTSRFIERHPQYKFKQSRSISAARKRAAQKEELIKHFERFEATMKEYNIDILLVSTEQKQIYLIDLENREYVTVIEAISTVGKHTEPMVILSGQLMKEKHFKNGLHDGVLMAATESGYSNDWLSFKWLDHWEENSRPDDPEEW